MQWSALLKQVIDPITRDAEETRQQVAHLVALVDGLGVRIARYARGDGALDTRQRECRETLMRYLTRFESA